MSVSRDADDEQNGDQASAFGIRLFSAWRHAFLEYAAKFLLSAPLYLALRVAENKGFARISIVAEINFYMQGCIEKWSDCLIASIVF